jgi:hypothetical protein
MSASGATNTLRNEKRSQSLTIGAVLPLVKKFCPILCLHPEVCYFTGVGY